MNHENLIRILVGTILGSVAIIAATLLFVIYAGLKISSAQWVLPVPLLMLNSYIVYRITVLKPNRFNIFLFLGFFLHFIGDILLVLADEPSLGIIFFGGLGAFFLGHLMNLTAFTISPFPDLPRPAPRIKWAIPFWLYGILIFLLIVFLGDVSPVIIIALAFYCVAFTSAAWRVFARYRYLNESKGYHICACVGYAIFMISDSLNGLGKFGVLDFNSLIIREVVVLGTYWIGQGLLAFSVDLTGAPDNTDVEIQLEDLHLHT